MAKTALREVDVKEVIRLSNIERDIIELYIRVSRDFMKYDSRENMTENFNGPLLLSTAPELSHVIRIMNGMINRINELENKDNG